jgi:hypothetical protein
MRLLNAHHAADSILVCLAAARSPVLLLIVGGVQHESYPIEACQAHALVEAAALRGLDYVPSRPEGRLAYVLYTDT